MHVLIAPDKFKGSLSAADVADAVADGLLRHDARLVLDRCPVADGGEGTLAAAVAAGYERRPVTVRGPTGQPVAAAYARRGPTAVVELAVASGLDVLPGGRPAPLIASSTGTGQLVGAALDGGATTVVLGLGGSAGTDGGAGLLQALGARLLDASGRDLAPGGAALATLDRVDLGGLHPRLREARVVVACDVDNPLLGPTGASAVFAPQKGASPQDVRLLDAALNRWARAVARATGRQDDDRPGAGAAGGVGFAALAVLGARMRPGVELVLELVGFADRLARAQLVVTGEGSLDRQSLRGKAPIGVAAAARSAGVPAVAVAGRVELSAAELAAAGLHRACALAELEPDAARSTAEARTLLPALVHRYAAGWLDLAAPARPAG